MWKINLKVLLLSAVVIGFYTMVAHVIPQLQSEVPAAMNLGAGASPEALATAGEAIYNGAGGCTACHGLGTRAPNLLTGHAGQGPIGARCGSRKAAQDCKAYLHESLIAPGAFLVPGFENIMPDVRRQLAAEQIWAVVAFLESQGGEVTVTAEDVQPAGGTTAAAAAAPAPSATTDPMALYREKGCIGCHQLAGEGGAVGPPFDRIGRQRSAEQLRRGILVPNADTTKGYEKFAGTMPTNFGQQLSAAQLEALVQFLASRR